MSAKSKAQQRLFQAAAHGATFPKAKALRSSMTLKQMSDYTHGSMTSKPEHVKAKKR